MAAAKNSNKVEDLRAKTDDQLSADLGDLKREQFNLRFQAATGQVEKTHRAGEIRKDIARIKTVLRSRQATA